MTPLLVEINEFRERAEIMVSVHVSSAGIEGLFIEAVMLLTKQRKRIIHVYCVCAMLI